MPSMNRRCARSGTPHSLLAGGSHEFLNVGERMFNARTVFHYDATGPMPAMAASKPGTGSASATRDWQGLYFDGATRPGKGWNTLCRLYSP